MEENLISTFLEESSDLTSKNLCIVANVQQPHPLPKAASLLSFNPHWTRVNSGFMECLSLS